MPAVPYTLRQPRDAVANRVDERLTWARAELAEQVRAHQERLARFPSAAPARRPSLPDRYARGFLWGLLLGLALEAAGLLLLPHLTPGVRAVGT